MAVHFACKSAPSFFSHHIHTLFNTIFHTVFYTLFHTFCHTLWHKAGSLQRNESATQCLCCLHEKNAGAQTTTPARKRTCAQVLSVVKKSG
jgi:hypothetical protein